jgi:hypothetical protein
LGRRAVLLDIRLEEHQRHIRLEHPDKSAIAEHSIDQGHRIQFHKSSILTMKPRYMDRIVSQGGHWDWTPPLQYQQKGWLLSQ